MNETLEKKEMNKRNMNTTFAVLAVLCAGSFAAPASHAGAGSDVGNGTGGDSLMSNVSHYPATEASLWCGSVGGYLDDALQFAQLANGPGEVRVTLVAAIGSILGAYESGGIPYQPLTYSLLARSLAIAAKFPGGEQPGAAKGDQSASIVLTHMVRVAKDVNRLFDIPRFVPMVRAYRQCGSYHCGDNGWDPPFYIDYISSAKTVLDMFFDPAIDNRPSRGSVLDSMAYDNWELHALVEILDWLSDDLEKDVFNRELGCVRTRVSLVQQRLKNFLNGEATRPFTEGSMRRFVEEALNDVREHLRYYSISGKCHR